MSKLEDLLSNKKLDPRRVVAASNKVERRSREDRAIALAKKQVRGGKSGEALEALAKQKPARSGKPLTAPLLSRAIRGDKLSGASKQRVLRAVNAALASKKQDAVELTDLF